MQHDGTEIVDAVGLVGMLMRQEYRVNVIDLGVDQLLAQVGRSIDQDSRNSAIPCALREQRSAPAAVFRVFGIPRTPAARRTRHATGRSLPPVAERDAGQNRSLARVTVESGGAVAVGAAGVKHRRQAGPAGGGDVAGKAALLVSGGAVWGEIIRPRLAQCHDLRMLR